MVVWNGSERVIDVTAWPCVRGAAYQGFNLWGEVGACYDGEFVAVGAVIEGAGPVRDRPTSRIR